MPRPENLNDARFNLDPIRREPTTLTPDTTTTTNTKTSEKVREKVILAVFSFVLFFFFPSSFLSFS